MRSYAFGALTTYVLTNQGEARQYIDYVVYLNRKDSHYLSKRAYDTIRISCP